MSRRKRPLDIFSSMEARPTSIYNVFLIRYPKMY
jgi:hypothetical protein